MGFSAEDRALHAKERKSGEVDSANIIRNATRPRNKISPAPCGDGGQPRAKRSKKPAARARAPVDPGPGPHGVLENMCSGPVLAGDIVLLRGGDFHPLRAARASETALFAATVQTVSSVQAQCAVEGLGALVDVGRGHRYNHKLAPS